MSSNSLSTFRRIVYNGDHSKKDNPETRQPFSAAQSDSTRDVIVPKHMIKNKRAYGSCPSL